MKSRNNENIFIKLSRIEVKTLKRKVHEAKINLIIGNNFLTKEEQKIRLLKLKADLLKAKTDLKRYLLEDKENQKNKKNHDRYIKKLTKKTYLEKGKRN